MANEKESPRKIRVCFVAPKAYPIFNPDKGDYFGGAEVDLYYLATEFARDDNFEVSFVVADYGQNDVEIIENVAVIKSLDFKSNVLTGILRTWNALKRADADIYVLKCASPGVPLVTMFCKLHRRIFVYRLAHLFESDGTYSRRHAVMGRLFDWSLCRADIIFAQNAVDAENLTKRIGVSSRVIPNGHRLPPVQRQTRDTILWVGRDDPLKKPELFFNLAQTFPNEHFTIVCQTLTNDRHYADLISEAGQIANLKFIRHVPFNQIETYFQRARVFVSTSEAEGFPNTFIQACKCGTPILSLSVNPDDFLGQQRCGFCANGDWDSFVRMFRELLIPANGQQYGANGRRFVEQNNDIAKIAPLYKQVFQQLTSR